MAWEKRDNRTYYYRTIHREGKVTKQYFGNGAVGRFAANVDALRRAERQAGEEVRQRKKDRLEAAVTLTCELNEACKLLASATLLAAGFHRPLRHQWRRWYRGKKEIRQSCRATRGERKGGR